MRQVNITERGKELCQFAFDTSRTLFGRKIDGTLFAEVEAIFSRAFLALFERGYAPERLWAKATVDGGHIHVATVDADGFEVQTGFVGEFTIDDFVRGTIW